jgi:hypothetical protein
VAGIAGMSWRHAIIGIAAVIIAAYVVERIP